METKNFYKNKLFFSLFVLSVFGLYFYLAYNTPLTHDDWTWGSSDGIHRLNNWFANYNGRYMGNLFELFLTRVYWIRFFVMSLFATVLVILAANQSKNNSYFNYILSLVLFLCVPINVISQTYAWIAGFSNYITSIVCVLLYLAIIKNIFEDDKPVYKTWMIIVVIPLGIITELFMEHITLYTLCMALIVIVFTAIKFRKVYAVHVTYFISTVIGAIIMFTNGAYMAIFSGKDQYRSIGQSAVAHESLVMKIYHTFTNEMYPMLFSNNVVLNLLIATFCIILIIKYKKSVSMFGSFIKNGLLTILVIYPLYKPIVVDRLKMSVFKIHTNDFEAFFSVIFFISVLLTIWLYTDNKNFKQKASLYWLSAIVLAAPLIFVQPFGPRCFIAPYTFYVMVTIQLGQYIIEKKYFNLFSLNKLFTIFALFVSACYIYIFTMNGMVDRQRMDYIHQQVNAHKDEIMLAKLPFEQFLWHSTPIIDSYQYQTFKEYYHIPENTKLKVISYKRWEKMNK
ncbi:hypothetical protein J5Y03_07150 [Bacillus sp. RG28]|uniref:Glucosyltransferase n=1 Tax=Gottfriedia endophytica TaxID=2820819 RepID=A0A940NNU7_9BACI|nr:DUF6056 family protein [Gottfriedia endophytica]MBP0724965.1 hypothetical protein [Gottfriedia endophytica]